MPDTVDNRSRSAHWAEKGIAGGPLRDHIHAMVFLLPLKGNSNAAGGMKSRASVVCKLAAGEEADVSDGTSARFTQHAPQLPP